MYSHGLLNKSPDINPIENVWGKLKDIVWQHKDELKNKYDLMDYIEDAFFNDKVILKTIENGYKSLPYRL
jgi:transposase